MTWHRLPARPDEGRVSSAAVDGRLLAVTRCGGKVGVLDGHCPHQGGPLGQGSIEGGWLRCPWHGYDYDPTTGTPPPGFTDAPAAYPVDERADGVWVDLPERPAPPRTVADVVVETLVAWGVRVVFGMVGHSNLGLADALRRAEEAGSLRYVGIRHEGAAAFAASAYGKLTGRPAACLAIAGPGSTNLLTGLYDARLDGAPVIALSGQVPSAVLGRGAFQDLDLSAAFGDVAVSTATLTAGSDHADLTARAVKHALDRRGPAHLVLPDEVQDQPSDAAVLAPEGRQPDRATRAPAAGVAAGAARLAEARRPVVIVGQGARGAAVEVMALAERLGAPVLTTFRAKGLVPEDHPLAAGVLGRSGTPVASWLMNESDRLLVVGASFANHTGIATYKPIVQVDDSPEAIGRFAAVERGLLGDAEVVLRDLLDALRHTDVAAADQSGDVAARRALWEREKARRAADDRGAGVASAALFAALSRACPETALIAVDVGNHAYSFGRYFVSRGQPVVMSGYLGSIGFGYPAALGLAAAAPDRPVVAVTGDGGFGQYLAELTTAVHHGLAVKHVLVDNGALGKISAEQESAGRPVWRTDLTNPDFAAYARLCGATGIGVRTAAELDAALAELFATPGPAMLHVHADPALV